MLIGIPPWRRIDQLPPLSIDLPEIAPILAMAFLGPWAQA